MVVGGDAGLVEGWGVAGLKGDAGGGGMRKGTAPEDDLDGVDDIRTTGNEGVCGRTGVVGFLGVSIWDAVVGARTAPLCEMEEEGREGVWSGALLGWGTGVLNNASKSSSAIAGAGRVIVFGLKGVAASGVARIAPCLLSIMAFCFPSGTSSSSSVTPFAVLGAGTSERKSRSSDDNERE